MENKKLVKGICLETGEHIEYYEGETPISPTIGPCQAVDEELFTPDMLRIEEYKAQVEASLKASEEAQKAALENQD